MNFKSVKLLGGLTVLFLISGFAVSYLERKVLELTELTENLKSSETALTLAVIFLGTGLFTFSTQTLYCRGKGILDNILHITAGLSLLTLLLIPFTWQSRTLYLYPYSYVEIGTTKVGLRRVKAGSSGIIGEFFIEKNGRKTEDTVSFNKPLISTDGFLWVKGITSVNGFPAVEVKFSSFSLTPFCFLTLFGIFTILLGMRLLKGGRDVCSCRREGAPETDRRALKTD